MNTANALLHSIRRALCEVPHEFVSESRRKELLETLRVTITGPTYRVRWHDGDDVITREYPKENFVFFRRGDRPVNGQTAPINTGEINRKNITKILQDMLETSQFRIPSRSTVSTLADRRRSTIGIWPWLLLLTAVLCSFERQVHLPIAVLLILILLERLKYSLLALGYLSVGILPWVGFPFTALGGLFGILVIIILSPRQDGRYWQIAGAAIVSLSFLLALMLGEIPAPAYLSPGRWLVLSVCLIAIIAGWTQGLNVCLVPLILPFFGVGAVLDGYELLSLHLGGLVIGRALILAFFPKIQSLHRF